MELMEHFLIEGGGSHTQAFVTQKGSLVNELILPSINRVGDSRGESYNTIDQLASFRNGFKQIQTTYFAIGAAGTPEYLTKISADLEYQWRLKKLPWEKIIITNDIVPFMFTEDENASQVIIIAGTGSGIAARNGFEKIIRAGANEYLLGDEGGAFDIGQKALRAVLQRRENNDCPTLLDDLALTWSNGHELNWFVYESSNPKQTIASFAPYVFQADMQNDIIAKKILDNAAQHLSQICQKSLLRLGQPRNVIVTVTGSLLNEPTERLFSRLKDLLLSSNAIQKIEIKSVDSHLLQYTSDMLTAYPQIFNAIAQDIPARIY